MALRHFIRLIVFAALTLPCVETFAQLKVSDDPIPGEIIRTYDQLAADGSTPDTKKYTLSGSVINAQTGEGVPRALVEANGQYATQTGSDGSFAFDGLAPGRYYLSSRKPGYFNPQADESRATLTDIGFAGPDAQPVTMKLIPEALISGRITDSDGLPVQRLPVHCLRSTVVEGHRQWAPAGSASTDEDGEYRIASLMAGIYRLAAGPSQRPALGAVAKTGKQFAGYGAAYYPASGDAGATGGMPITAGQKLVIDLSVDAEPFYSISGTFNVPPGFSVGMSLVPRDQGREQSGGMMVRRDSNGFSMRMVSKGDYMLQATAHAENKDWSSYVPLHVSGDISDLQITLQPGITIPVNASTQRTQVAAQPVSTIRDPRFNTPQVVLKPVGESGGRAFLSMPLRDDRSLISIENVVPGTYKAWFSGLADLYVASARYGGTDLLRENLVIGQSAGGDAIEIVLRDDGGKVKGTVTSDGQPALATLLVLPDHGPAYAPTDGITSPTGELFLQQLPPGSYSILAFDTLNDLEYANAEALDPYRSRAVHVDIAPNQEVTVKLELIKRGGER